MTFTAIGVCPESGRLGIGIATYSIGVGGYCPFIERGVGALSTQAFANPALGPPALAALREAVEPEQVLARLAESDPGFDWRQVVVATPDGRVAAHTGPGTRPWSGHVTGEGFAVFGNVLAGRETVDAMAAAWRDGRNDELPERLLAALEAGRDAGGLACPVPTSEAGQREPGRVGYDDNAGRATRSGRCRCGVCVQSDSRGWRWTCARIRAT